MFHQKLVCFFLTVVIIHQNIERVNTKIHFYSEKFYLFLDPYNQFVYNRKCEVIVMSMVQKIRIACVMRGNITESELARRLGTTPQNFNNKMKRDNFSEKDLQDIAAALGLQVEINFVDPETGTKI